VASPFLRMLLALEIEDILLLLIGYLLRAECWVLLIVIGHAVGASIV
jgi:hypothetical protein